MFQNALRQSRGFLGLGISTELSDRSFDVDVDVDVNIHPNKERIDTGSGLAPAGMPKSIWNFQRGL